VVSRIPRSNQNGQVAVQSSGLTDAKPSLGGSSSKRKAAETLEYVAKRSRINSDDTDVDLDVTVQTGLYAVEMFSSNLGVNYLLDIIVIGGVLSSADIDRALTRLVQTM
jgi:hypothetical protein